MNTQTNALHFDTLIHARWVLTVENDHILENQTLAIKDGRINHLVSQSDSDSWTADEVVTLNDHVVMPGLINLHGHSAMTLLRGYADDKQLMDWLHNYIWPAEGRHVNDAFVHEGSLIGMAEMIKSGTTTINDMYFYNDAVARAAQVSGMRTFVGCSVLEFPTNYAQNADEYIQKAMQEREAYLNQPLIQFTLAPHAPYTVSDQTFKQIAEMAQEHHMLVHCHMHETMDEVNNSLKEFNKRPLARLNDLGFLDTQLIAAHMVHLTAQEIELVAAKGISVAHNPTSNMKLSSGIAPIPQLLAAEVNVGVGTDGAASNNKLDMLAETRQTALLAKVGRLNPTDVPAYQAIEMATINGARALKIDQQVGSIRVGKQADLIAINMAELETAPTFDVISHIVYAAGREHVTHTWVAGQCLMTDRTLKTLDESALKQTARQWHSKMAS